MKNNVIESTMDLYGAKLTLQTGKLAPQADRAVFATLGGTTVLATVVSKKLEEDLGFLPLTVIYEEKLYAAGIIKGSRWIKREGRSTDEEVATARLIDHCVRPLFPKDLRDDIQLVVTVMSYDGQNSPELLGMVASSAVLTASSIPFKGPFATLHLGCINQEVVVNPTHEAMSKSDLDMYISYLKEDKVQAMEAKANIVTDEIIKNAIKLGSEKSKDLLTFIEDFAKKVDTPKRDYKSFNPSEEVYKEVTADCGEAIKKLVFEDNSKQDYSDKYSVIAKEETATLNERHKDDEKYPFNEVVDALDNIAKKYIRERILTQDTRIDGRSLDDIRPISGEVDILPQVHGSALFNRGLTQGLSVVTLGSLSNGLLSESLDGEHESFYFHHYVGLGFSTGEPKRMMGPGRREIGHGMLAEKALGPVLPSLEDFPYTIRVVSEILSQDGSSSMAATCGSSLALMAAGVPIKSLVGGVSIGLITNDEHSKYVVLTDIQGTEDFSGFMDFKMTGTKEGVTAIQMDIKLAGIPLNVFEEVVDKSKKARLNILEKMSTIIDKPALQVKESAPKNKVFKIELGEIGMIIGGGGKTIKEIEARFGVKVDITEKENIALVSVSSFDKEKVAEAIEYAKKILEKPEIGKTYEGTVVKIMDFGGFVEFLPGKEGLVHVSEITNDFVKNVNDYLKEGDHVTVKLKDITDDRKYVLTMKV